MLRKKKCTDCKLPKLLGEFNLDKHKKDGHRSRCRACEKDIRYCRPLRKWRTHESSAVHYQVIYDPLDSFGENSSFTRQEIEDMLHEEYLAIGTRFRRGKYEYRVNDDLCLKAVAA